MSYHYSLPHPPHQLGTPPIQSENGTKVEQQEPSLPSTANPTPPPTAISAAEPAETGTSDAPAAAEIIQVDTEEKTTAHPTQPSHTVPQAQLRPVPPTSSYPGGLPIDVCFEASKLPLDVAIFNSARACGGDDKIRKFLQAVLVIGGGAHIPGMAHALESRSVSQCSILSPFFFSTVRCRTDCRPLRRLWCRTWKRCRLYHRQKTSILASLLGRVQPSLVKWIRPLICGSHLLIGYVCAVCEMVNVSVDPHGYRTCLACGV